MTPNNTKIQSGSSKSSDSPVEESSKQIVSNAFDNAYDEPYTDKRVITISPVRNYSNYRKVNIAALGPRKDVIGSSIRSSQILSSNTEELAAYFPALVGLSPSNPEFVTAVKSWLSNIHIVVGDKDVTLNTSFVYNKKSDYEMIKAKEDAINKEFDKTNRASIRAIEHAVARKIEALNILESSKCKYGHPENIEEYLMYRHCLLYPDVAKDIALINSNSNIRFYIKDEEKEREKERKLVDQRIKAINNFNKLNQTDSNFDATFVAISVYNGADLNTVLYKNRSEKAATIIEFMNNHPDKFNKIIEDKYTKLKADIETLIARGELVRSDFNQQISTSDGTFVGANINDAVLWFENPEHKDIRTAFENKLNSYNM